MDIVRASTLLLISADNTVDEIVAAAHAKVQEALVEEDLHAVASAYRAMKVLLTAGGQTTPEEADRYFAEINAAISKIKELADRRDVETFRLQRQRTNSERVIADNEASIAAEEKSLTVNAKNQEACSLHHNHLKAAYLLELASNIAVQ